MPDIRKIEIFENNKTTLKEASRDNHDGTCIYMTDSLLEVVNFDLVKDEYIREMELSEHPNSNDVLFFPDDRSCYFIEFRNGYIRKPDIFEIRLKIFDSLLIFCDIIGKGVSYTRSAMRYILVYNEEKNQIQKDSQPGVQISGSRRKIAKYFVEGRAKNKFIDFNLSRFEKLYFKEVYTFSKEDFEKEFVQKYSNDSANNIGLVEYCASDGTA